MRSLVLAAFLATLSLAPAQADISWKTDEIAPGSALVLKNSDGRVFTHVRRASKGSLIRFDAFAGRSERGAYVGSYLTNARGEILRTIAADGSETDYEPHKCNRSRGRCTYIIQTPDGVKIMRTRITEATPEGLKFQEYEAGKLVASGVVKLDRFGSSAGGWTVDHTTGQRLDTTRLAARYK